VSSSGDLVEDLTHNFFIETGARNNKLKVYELVDHPAARALTGYLLVPDEPTGQVSEESSDLVAALSGKTRS
jgi:Mn-containing catalase